MQLWEVVLPPLHPPSMVQTLTLILKVKLQKGWIIGSKEKEEKKKDNQPMTAGGWSSPRGQRIVWTPGPKITFNIIKNISGVEYPRRKKIEVRGDGWNFSLIYNLGRCWANPQSLSTFQPLSSQRDSPSSKPLCLVTAHLDWLHPTSNHHLNFTLNIFCFKILLFYLNLNYVFFFYI